MRRLILLTVLTFAAALPGRAHPIEYDGPPFGGDESNSDYFLRKSDDAFHEGDYERAVLLHKARVAIDPEAVDSYGVAAWLLWSMGKGDEAAEFLERGIKINPDNWEMWNEAGQQYDLQKRLVRAEETYKRAVELLPPGEPSQMLRRRLAHAAEKTGDFTTSVQTWRALVKDYPDQAVNQNNLRRVEKLAAEAGASQTKNAAGSENPAR